MSKGHIFTPFDLVKEQRSNLNNLIKVDDITADTDENGNVSTSISFSDRQVISAIRRGSNVSGIVTYGRNSYGYLFFHVTNGKGEPTANTNVRITYLYTSVSI